MYLRTLFAHLHTVEFKKYDLVKNDVSVFDYNSAIIYLVSKTNEENY